MRIIVSLGFGILILASIKILAKLKSIGELLMGNKEALADLQAAVADVVTALDDLAAKLAGGADISGDLATLTSNLRAAIAKDDPPTV